MVKSIPAKTERALRHIHWDKITDYIIRYLKKETKQTPRIVRLHGADNFELRDGKLFVYGREVITDKKRKQEIINKAETGYGGLRKSADRLNRYYFNISRNDVRELYKGSERRQLKARQQKANRIESFIHANRPGTLQVDLTFYRASNIPVFGAVDVFSRYAYYERVPNKRADVVVKAMQNCLAHFRKVMHKDRRVVKVSSDAGVEFQAEFRAYLKAQKIHYDKQVRSRKMIESLNRTLRRYIEHVGWDTIKELDELITKFMEGYNRSKHTSTKQAPIDLVSASPEKEVIESDRARKAGKKRIGKKGYKLPPLKKGDTVRIYDPKRAEIKAQQKVNLKGKIKLNAGAYVKQYTSTHRGQAPHWTKEVFIIDRVMGGKRATRYLLVGKKGAYMQSELQRVSKVTKPDPRIKKKAQQQKVKDKLLERRPGKLRYIKYIDKYVYFKGDSDEQRGLCIDVYKDMYLFVLSRSKLYLVYDKILQRLTTDKHMTTKEREKYEGDIANAQRIVDDYLSGESNNIPTFLVLPKASPKQSPKPSDNVPKEKQAEPKPKAVEPKPKPKDKNEEVKQMKYLVRQRCIFLWDGKHWSTQV